MLRRALGQPIDRLPTSHSQELILLALQYREPTTTAPLAASQNSKAALSSLAA